MAEEELERFRREWQNEVIARRSGAAPAEDSTSSRPQAPRRMSGRADKTPRVHRLSQSKSNDDEAVHLGAYDFDDLEERERARQLGESGQGVHPESRKKQEPQSALEHYEKAVERETQGKLGDSLIHYRRAFRLDDRVDQQYKNKHFPPSSFAAAAKPQGVNPSNASPTVPNPAHHSLHGPPATTSSTGSELLASYASSAIVGASPLIEGTPPPPCPIASVPHEILAEILLRSALADVASFVRLAQVCKRLAYLVGTEERIWKRVCQGSEWGFGAMHYRFACTVEGKPLPRSLSGTYDGSSEDDRDDGDDYTSEHQVELAALTLSASTFPATKQPPTAPILLLLSPNPSYKHTFQHSPRVRFSGLYISTVNYVRPGAASPSQATWNSPVHVVTYYRYLRFRRDGSCISLLTTVEPAEVVPHLKEEVLRGGGTTAATALALGGPGMAAVAKHALRGRWRLSGMAEGEAASTATVHPTLPSASEQAPKTGAGAKSAPLSPRKAASASMSLQERQGYVLIETAGPTPAYTYSMRLRLDSPGGGKKASSGNGGQARNTRLAWVGFWSYNHLTDDWAEFGLRNDRAFVWSRVRSWVDA